MDTQGVRTLAKEQTAEIASALNAHRPLSLYDMSTNGSRLHIQALRSGGRPMAEEWNMEIRGGDMFLSVTIGGFLYQEVLRKDMPSRFTRAMNGLRDWGKAVNAIELKELLSGQPQLAHLQAEHVMNPDGYYPLGGERRW